MNTRLPVRCRIIRVGPWVRSDNRITVGASGPQRWEIAEASAEAQYWAIAGPRTATMWVMNQGNNRCQPHDGLVEFTSFQSNLDPNVWLSPRIDGCSDGHLFDIKWLHSNEEYVVGDVITIFMTQYQRKHCDYFIVVQTKDFYHNIYQGYKIGIHTDGTPAWHEPKWVFQRQEFRLLACVVIPE